MNPNPLYFSSCQAEPSSLADTRSFHFPIKASAVKSGFAHDACAGAAEIEQKMKIVKSQTERIGMKDSVLRLNISLCLELYMAFQRTRDKPDYHVPEIRPSGIANC